MDRTTPKRVGIVDVVREPGVPTATVSFVLAGKNPVAEATRERVLKVVRQSGSAEPACTGAASQGLMLSLMNCQLDVRREVSYLNTVFDDVPDGIIYVPMSPDAAWGPSPLIMTGEPEGQRATSDPSAVGGRW